MLKKRIFAAILTSVFILISIGGAYAKDVFPGARALGMGGAYVAVVDDNGAAYWNPAGLRKIGFLSINPTFTLHSSSMQLQDIWEMVLSQEFPEEIVLPAALDLAGQVGFSGRALGFNVIVEANADFVPGESEQPVGEAKALVSGALTVATTPVKVPASLLAVHAGGNLRVLYGRYYALNQEEYKELSAEGRGYALDAGVLIEATPVITLGARATDLFGKVLWSGTETSYTNEEKDVEWEENLTPDYRVGIAVKPPLTGLIVACDIEDPGAPSQALYLGVEKRLLGLGSLRAGMMSKETGKTYTVGAGFGLGFAQVDAAIASEDFREITAAAISVSLSF